MNRTAYYLVNALTLYRLLAFGLLLFLIFTGQYNFFKWALSISFFTDAIDGFLARYYKVESVLGAKLDSAADDLTVAAAIIGMWMFRSEFFKEHLTSVIVLLILFLIQTGLALAKYGRMTTFHTYLAKLAAVLQAVFLLLFFFLPQSDNIWFYIAMVATSFDLLEEIAMVVMLPRYKTNVRGLYWILKLRNKAGQTL